MNKSSAKAVALGGILCAMAMVIMCLVGLIPLATYICPMLCCILAQFVFIFCGKRIAWAWYIIVAVLSLLLAPDKEAAMIFLVLGYYPIIKPGMDRMRFPVIFKFLLFNLAGIAAYVVLYYIMGLPDLEMEEVGTWLFWILFILGNTTFFLLDRVLLALSFKWRKKTHGTV